MSDNYAGNPDVVTAHTELEAKGPVYDRLWGYYEGTAPLRYSTKRLEAAFRAIGVRFSENWCSAVVNAAVDRVNLSGFLVSGQPETTARLGQLFDQTELGLDSDDVHLASLVCGESYMIIWPEDEGGRIEAYYNDPRMVHVQYQADNPRKMAWAAKRWVTDDGMYRLTIYYPDRLEYFYTTTKAENVSGPEAYLPSTPPMALNPYKRIPVFHFRRSIRAIRSELVDVIPPQDAINKLLSDMMVSAEFGAYRQRYVISEADTAALKNAPNEVWRIPGSDGVGQATSVGEFSQTDLNGYLTAIDKLASAIAIISRTPKHYLMLQGGDPSGEALIAMEAPLVRKVERYIERFSSAWRRAAEFMLLLSGVVVPQEDITAIFDPVNTIQPVTQAQVGVLKLQLGISKKQVQREIGYTEEQILTMETEAKAEQKSLGEELMRQFEQGGPVAEEEPAE